VRGNCSVGFSLLLIVAFLDALPFDQWIAPQTATSATATLAGKTSGMMANSAD
jgi:hypothetical protein